MFLGSMLASFAGIFAQISNFVEYDDADNPFSDISDDMDVHVADLDGDGFDEVIFQNSDLTSIRYFQNDGTGQFTELDANDNPLTPVQNIGILNNGDNKRFDFADFDNDGDVDVAVFSQKYYNDGELSMFANDGSQNYDLIADNLSIPLNRSNGVFTDVDEDGDIDCLSNNFIYDDDNKIWNAYLEVAYFDDVTSTFDDFQSFTGLEGAEILFVDIDEDNDEDAFVLNGGQITWAEKTGANAFESPLPSLVSQMQNAETAHKIDVGDFDGDGRLDMVLYDPGQTKMRYFEQSCADPPGTVCDDGDECTENDVLDADCNCAGTALPDSDMDGICDAIDDTNGDCQLGGACDDGDECTENDVFDADCNCAGTALPDSDMDGICDEIDETNGDCDLGGACDDGDDCTIDDVFDADCNCAGTFQDSDMDGICDAEDDTNGDCELGGACDDGDECTADDAFDADCQCIGIFQDADGDGVCDAEDQCPGLDDTLLDTIGDADMDGDVDCDDLLVSIDELLSEQFMLFPNPTEGLIHIQSEHRILGIDVYSAQGRFIRAEPMQDNSIDLSGFSAGMYIIEIKIEEVRIRKKIVKNQIPY